MIDWFIFENQVKYLETCHDPPNIKKVMRVLT